MFDASGITVDAARHACFNLRVQSDLFELALLTEEAGDLVDQLSYVEEVIVEGEIFIGKLG